MFQLLKTHLETTSFSLGVVLKEHEVKYDEKSGSCCAEKSFEGFLLGWWLDLMLLEVFSNLNNSMIQQAHRAGEHTPWISPA